MRRTVWGAGALGAALVVSVAGPAAGAGLTTERVTLSTAGSEIHVPLREGLEAAVSADGSVVAFVTAASDVVAGDTNGLRDVFVRDRVAGTTVRVSLAADGRQFAGYSGSPMLSADGRTVVFTVSPYAPYGLPPGQVLPTQGTYRYDASPGSTRRLAIPARDEPFGLSGDGRYVLTSDSFVLRRYDLRGGGSEIVTATYDGSSATEYSEAYDSSPDGRFVLFSSCNNHLVAGDTLVDRSQCAVGGPDLFVRDLTAGRTWRVGLRPDGTRFREPYAATISGDGSTVAFMATVTRGEQTYPGVLWVRDVASAQTRRAPGQALRSADINGLSLDRTGRNLLFTSGEPTLVPRDTNGWDDVFRADLATGMVRRIDLSTDGRQANGPSGGAVLSADGRQVLFSSLADNLVPGDRNAAADLFVRSLE